MEELDIKELIWLFWKKKVQVILIVFIFFIIGICYTILHVDPLYQSYTTLVLKQVSIETNDTQIEKKDDGTTYITQNDVMMNQKLVSTYSELIKSKTVIREVLRNLGKENEITEKEIRNNIQVTSVEDTEFIKISVQNRDPKNAADIANEIAKVFSNKIVEIYNISNIQVVDEAEISTTPCNINHIRDISIFIAIGLVVGLAYVLLLNLFDSTIKNEDEIEKEVGLLTLAIIPECDFSKKRGGKNR